VTPWLRVVPPELRSSREDGPVDALMRNFGRVVGDRAVYLDPAGTPRRDSRLAPLGPEYVTSIYEAASAHLAFAPVYRFGRPDLAAVTSKYATGETGLGFLVKRESALMLGGRRLNEELRREADALGVDRRVTDVMLDLGLIPPEHYEADSVIWLLRQVMTAGDWRSVIVAGTAGPGRGLGGGGGV